AEDVTRRISIAVHSEVLRRRRARRQRGRGGEGQQGGQGERPVRPSEEHGCLRPEEPRALHDGRTRAAAARALRYVPMGERILVVEDDDQLGAQMTERLRAEGYEVTWLRDGSEAARA